jgi:hypothetical protein
MGLMAFAAFGLASINSPLLAQFGGGGAPPPTPAAPNHPSAYPTPGLAAMVELKEPTDYRVYQRDANDKAEIPINLVEAQKTGKIVGAVVTHTQADSGGLPGVKLVESRLVGVPTGGPYTIRCQIKQGTNVVSAEVNNVYVGDLWVWTVCGTKPRSRCTG